MFIRYRKIATLIADTATEQRRVFGIKNGNISIGHRQSLFINDETRQMTVCFVSTFYIYFPFPTFINTNRIETDNLH